jgi:hypothetical protein
MPDLELLPDVHDVSLFQLIIQNPTSYATASPHVQHIAIQDSYLTRWLGASVDARRIAFADPQTGALAPSWYDWFDGTYHHWFVKTSKIPASSSYTLYLIYSYRKTLVDGKTAGISAWAGQYFYSIPYGQLDNGSSIFLLYDNFAGTSLSSAWTQYLNGGSISVNNGLTMTSTSSAGSSLGLVRSLTAPSIGVAAHAMFDVLQCCGCSGGNDFSIELGNSLTVPWSGNGYGVGEFGGGGSAHAIIKVSNGSWSVLIDTSLSCSTYNNVFHIFEWLYTTTSYLYRYNSLGITQSISDTTWTSSAISQFMIGVWKPNSGTTSHLVHHVAVYDAPPVQPDLPIYISPVY